VARNIAQAILGDFAMASFLQQPVHVEAGHTWLFGDSMPKTLQ